MNMKNEEMTDEEKANTDKLEFYYNEKIKVHIILKREIHPGKNLFYNGYIKNKISDRLWLIADKKGEEEVSISEIKDRGVSRFKEDNTW